MQVNFSEVLVNLDKMETICLHKHGTLLSVGRQLEIQGSGVMSSECGV